MKYEEEELCLKPGDFEQPELTQPEQKMYLMTVITPSKEDFVTEPKKGVYAAAVLTKKYL